jgi:hypothetical protein
MNVAAFLARFLEPMGECLDAESARRIVDFEVPAGVQERVEALAGRANEGLLSDEERAEYEALIDAGDLVLRRFPEVTHLCSPEMTQAF